MWTDALDWLEFTYPVSAEWEGSEAERTEEVEQICLRRLEAIHWPGGPTCPKCETCDDDAPRWKHAPRGLGWRCRGCKARFHILQALPAMARTHRSMSVWFRALFLIEQTPNLTSVALG